MLAEGYIQYAAQTVGIVIINHKHIKFKSKLEVYKEIGN